jgi:syntaxin-binding protein 5
MAMDRVNQKMKKINLRGIFDGFRSNANSTGPKVEIGIEETLTSDHFKVAKVIRHGFPHQPTALAYDCVQHLLAVGTKSGSIRIFGQPGVDCHLQHDLHSAVLQLLFLTNEIAGGRRQTFRKTTRE